jgi:glycerol-3-phosphate O-acyltransferase/dihydroxyacetone phosphate acyltransferase
VLLCFPLLLCSWAKDSLFTNFVARTILVDAGNIPVDRKTRNNQQLFAGTFDALKLGESVAIFPEGTSYTEPGIKFMKDGASWVCILLCPIFLPLFLTLS